MKKFKIHYAMFGLKYLPYISDILELYLKLVTLVTTIGRLANQAVNQGPLMYIYIYTSIYAYIQSNAL